MASKPTPSFLIREILRKFRAHHLSPDDHGLSTQELNSYSARANNDSAKERGDATIANPRDEVTTPYGGYESLSEAHAESRPFVHKYFFRRPRLLQYYEQGELVDSNGRRSSVDVYEHLVDETSGDPKIQRDFLNLFIDLLWAGIISNISENFVVTAFEPDASWGLAFLEFTVLFLTAFKMWNYLRKFLNNFFNKDYLQSMFIIWILVLALYFGNQAPYFLAPGGNRIIILTYLTAKFSFIGIEILYAIFIPQLRRQIFITVLAAVPISGLWIGALKTTWPSRAALIIPALMCETFIATLMALPVGDWFLKGASKKALDPDNLVDRLQGFFIIILGEGIVTLTSGLAAPRIPLGIATMLIYYVLFSLYFRGDLTKTYIHAVFRNQYTAMAFQSIHVFLYGSLLLLDASIKYFLSLDATESTTLDNPDPAVLQDRVRRLNRARWTISAGLTTVIICVTVKALLNRSLDGPRTLLVNNRYLRMAPRALVVIVVICLPFKTGLTITGWLSIVLAIMLPLLLWEYIAAMEKGSRVIEPKETMD